MSTQITFRPAGNEIASRKGLERVADIDPRLTRSHYFDNRLLTAEDLTRDQIYLDGRLREVGRALGYGIMRGFETRLNSLDGELEIGAGVGVTSAGRVLELSETLTLDLNDKAKISDLNYGKYRRFNRALYAVIIKYTEMGTDVEEVFPTDLGDKKDVQYDVVSEGVQLAMVPLQFPLMQQNPLNVRSYLMQKFYYDNTAGGAIPDDAIGLGVIAIDHDRPQWFDAELLRQPLRVEGSSADRQFDLFRRYQNIFSDVMDQRRSGSLTGDFAATDYFHWLPPVGALPKDSIDPVTGRQGYFPENYNVSIAPIRKSEINLIMKESMVLPPLNVHLDEPMDVVVLTPLTNTDYANFASRLEQPANLSMGKPAGMDLLKLRLYPKRPVHKLDLDRSTWEAIWELIDEEELIFVRRPLRTAETQLSGIVLNSPPVNIISEAPDLPSEIPTPSEVPSPSDRNLLADEDTVFLRRVNISSFMDKRVGQSPESREAAAMLDREFGQQGKVVQQIMNVLLVTEPAYDTLIWPTLLHMARGEELSDFYKELQSRKSAGDSTPQALIVLGPTFGLNRELVTQWSELT